MRDYLRGHLTGHSAVAGDLHVQGPLRRPSEINLAGNFTDAFADIESVKLHNQGPFRFSISNRLLKVEQFHLLGDNTDISGDGSIDLAGNREIDFRARGQLNLQLIQSYNPDFTSTGMVNVDMTLAGTIQILLRKGVFKSPMDPSPMLIPRAHLAESMALSPLARTASRLRI